MSWVFLAGNLVYKLKKPIAYPFLISLRSRRGKGTAGRNCASTRALPKTCISTWSPSMRARAVGFLRAVGPVADWLVRMRRLPDGRMLDVLIDAGSVDAAEVRRAAEKLARFYAGCPALDVTAAWVMARFRSEHEEDLRLLSDARFALEPGRTRRALGMMATALDMVLPFIEARAAASAYVEGHGDLRPEHVCLAAEPVFIDCLEFNRDLRVLDPFDEISYLGLECRGWVLGGSEPSFCHPPWKSWAVRAGAASLLLPRRQGPAPGAPRPRSSDRARTAHAGKMGAARQAVHPPGRAVPGKTREPPHPVTRGAGHALCRH